MTVVAGMEEESRLGGLVHREVDVEVVSSSVALLEGTGCVLVLNELKLGFERLEWEEKCELAGVPMGLMCWLRHQQRQEGISLG